MPGLAAGLSHKHLVKGKDHKAPLCEFIRIYTRTLFLYAAIRRTDDQCRIFFCLIQIFGPVEISCDGNPVTVIVTDMFPDYISFSFVIYP